LEEVYGDAGGGGFGFEIACGGCCRRGGCRRSGCCWGRRFGGCGCFAFELRQDLLDVTAFGFGACFSGTTEQVLGKAGH
jgi:hypothetical protein